MTRERDIALARFVRNRQVDVARQQGIYLDKIRPPLLLLCDYFPSLRLSGHPDGARLDWLWTIDDWTGKEDVRNGFIVRGELGTPPLGISRTPHFTHSYDTVGQIQRVR